MDSEIKTQTSSSFFSNKKVVIVVLAVVALIIVLVSTKVITINTTSPVTGNRDNKSNDGEDLESYINDFMVKQDIALKKLNSEKN